MRIAALLLLAALAAPAEGRTLRWERWHVDGRLDADGVLRVTETARWVFDGDWNGGERIFRLRVVESLDLRSIARITGSGETIPLRRDSDLDAVDEWDWHDSKTLRWRAREASAPPFSDTPITYRIDYSISGVPIPQGDGGWLLDLDVAPSDLEGTIEHLSWSFTLDPTWSAGEAGLTGERRGVAPGEHVVLRVPMHYAGSGHPASVARFSPPLALAAVGAIPLLLVGWLAASFVRDERRKGRFVRLPPIDTADRPWLEQHVLRFPPEVVGAAWDDRTASAEVAAVLARLVQEGKLTSRVEPGGWLSSPTLHLELNVPRETLAGYERALIDAFFIDGSKTDTRRIREHYKSTGFDPASKIRKGIEKKVAAMGRGRKAPAGGSWKRGTLLFLAGAAIAIFAGVSGGRADLIAMAVSLGAAFVFLILGLIAAGVFQSRVGGFALPGTFVALPIVAMLGGIALLSWIAATVVPIRPLLIAGMGLVAASLADFILGIARIPQSRERIAMRRELFLARERLRRELRRESPDIDDVWFPWLLALGLGPQVDRWFRAFGGAAGAAIPPRTASGSGGGSSGWSGGGGAFGGAGASGAWGVAAASLGSGVSAPSSGGSGGGGGSSGGGGAGGW
ncbi:MAG TPA: hypothetical protein VMS56_02515 [Thermoanaerobaculia bacterium]|nr:hypothetical protein [Thermoanaerobaculia bacterium]